MSSPFFASSITKGVANSHGWRHLLLDRADSHIGKPLGPVKKSLINLIHITDTHICDAQSPARVEYLDRYADPHHPASSIVGTLIGTYRAHEILTTQVLESAVQAINRIDLAPVTKTAISAVLITGDLTDNAQSNELDWLTTLLLGGKLRADSGAKDKWEGVGGEFYSPFFWNPHGTPKGERNDFPRDLYGFPTIPELLHAIRQPFYSSGLKYPFLAVHGNHDALLQGTVVPNEELRESVTSDEKIFELSDEEALQALSKVSEQGPAAYPSPIAPKVMTVSADESRDFLSPIEWNINFYREDEDNGISSQHLGSDRKYWRKDYESIIILALDTVNPFGGWQGSIDQEQFNWLKEQVEQIKDKYIVITSHHPIQDIYNGYSPSARRVLGAEIESYLITKPAVIAWICGHTHRHRIAYFGPDITRGFYQIETSSLIDWPQQGRIIEIFLTQDDEICIASTVFNHQGSILPDYEHLRLDEVNELSGLSRILSLNDWQRRGGIFAIENNEGEGSDRNSILCLPKRVLY
jgi:metallophosphoesterase (TIGR03767 family)